MTGERGECQLLLTAFAFTTFRRNCLFFVWHLDEFVCLTLSLDSFQFQSSEPMSLSFWKHSPGPHWSHTLKAMWSPVEEPYIFQQSFAKTEEPSYKVLTLADIPDILHLYDHHYHMFPKSRVSLTKELLETFLTDDGVIILGIRHNLLLVGCIFLRPLGFLMSGRKAIGDHVQAGLVDFFCVHKNHRGKGVGSSLLWGTVQEGFQRGISVFFFVKEGLPHTLCPPLRTSTYIWRPRTKPAPVNLHRFLTVGSKLPEGAELWNAPRGSHHATVYECTAFKLSVYVAVTDMFHRSEPGGLTMGEIVWIWYDITKGKLEDQQLVRVLETVVDTCKFDLLFMDKALPHDPSLWTTDVTYSWYAYNFYPKQFFSTQLALTF